MTLVVKSFKKNRFELLQSLNLSLGSFVSNILVHSARIDKKCPMEHMI